MKFDLMAHLEDAYDLCDKIYDNYDWNLIKTVFYSIEKFTDYLPQSIEPAMWLLYTSVLRDCGPDKKMVQIELNKLASDRRYYSPKEFNKEIIVPLQTILSKLKKLSVVQKKNRTKKTTDEFGMYAWANHRRPLDVPLEKDTPIERKVLTQLTKHFDSDFASRSVTTNSAQVLKTLLKKNKYPDVIKAPTCKIIKRGMSVTKSELMKLLGKFMPMNMIVGKKTTIKHNFTYIPKGEISSWTSDVDVAKDFYKLNSNKRKTYCIILMAQVSENSGKLLQCDNALYKIASFAENNNEHEVIAIGNVKVSSIIIELIFK